MSCLGVCLMLVAAAPSTEFDDALRNANQLRKKLEYEQALEQAVHARHLAANRGERRDAAVLTGVLLYELDRTAEARVAFRDALTADPGMAAPANASPKLLEDFERERQVVKRRAAKPNAAEPLGTKLDDDDADPEVKKAPPPAEPAPAQPAAAEPAPPPVETARAAPAAGSRLPGVVVLAAGALLLVIGVGFEIDATGAANALRQAGLDGVPRLSVEEGDQVRQRGQRSQLLAGVELAAGAALAAIGTLLAVIAPGGGPRVALVAGPGQAGLACFGSF